MKTHPVPQSCARTACCRRISAAALALALGGASVRALDLNIPFPGAWTGGSGSWHSLNWAPQPLDFAELLGIPIPFPTWPDNLRSEAAGLGFNYLVAIPGGSPRLDNDVRIGTLALNEGAGLRLRGGAELELDGITGFEGGGVFNDGTVELDENASITAGLGGLVFEGNGSVWIKDGGSSLSASVIEHGRGHTIHGQGDIEAIGLIDNRGDIVGDFAPGTDLKLDTIHVENEGTLRGTNGGRVVVEAESFDNDGLLEADGGLVKVEASSADNDGEFRARRGGNLQVTATELKNASGLIQALEGAAVDFRQNSVLDGGRLATDGTGAIRLLEGAVTVKGQIINAGLLQGVAAAVNLSGVALLNTTAGIYDLSTNSPTVAGTPLTLSGGTFRGGGTLSATEPVTLDGGAEGMTLTNFTLTVLGASPVPVGRLEVRQTVTNHGLVRLDEMASLTTVSNATFQGTGELHFANPAPVTGNGLFATWGGSGVVTNGPGHTVRGGVHAGHGQFDLVNQGTFIADKPRRMELEFSNGRSVTNTGTLLATQGALLRINQGRFENAGGFIGADAGAVVELAGVPSIHGGTLGGEGVIQLPNHAHFFGTADPISIESPTLVQVLSSVVLNAYGTITNEGEIFLNNTRCCGAGPETRLTAAGELRLEGGGRVTFGPANADPNVIAGLDEASRLVVGPRQTITTRPDGGGGTIRAVVENFGRVGVEGTGVVTVFNAVFTNRGTMFSSGGGRVQVGANLLAITVDNRSAVIDAGADSFMDYSSAHGPSYGAATVIGGTLRGAGTHRVARYLVLDGGGEPVRVEGTVLHLPGSTDTVLVGNLHLDGATIFMTPSTGGLGTFGPNLNISGPVNLTGTGQVLFGPAFLQNASVIRGDHLTLGADITLLTTNSTPAIIETPLENHGTINARAGSITIQHTNLVNLGVLRAEGGGQLLIGSPNRSATLDNTAGVIESAAGGFVQFASRWINSSQVVTLNGGVLRGEGVFVMGGLETYLLGDLVPVTLRNTTLTIPGNSYVNARGTVTLDGGRLLLRDNVIGIGTHPAALVATAPLTFTGQGAVEFGSFNGNTDNVISGAPLTFESGVALQTTNRATGIVQADVVNRGVLDARDGRLHFQNRNVANHGVIRAGDSGTVELGGPADHLTVDNAGAALEAAAGGAIAYSVGRGVTVLGGTLRGAGLHRLQGGVILDGRPEPVRLEGTTAQMTGNTDTHLHGDLEFADATVVMLPNTAGLGSFGPRLNFSSPTRLSGTGRVVFGPSQLGNASELRGEALTLGDGITLLTTNSTPAVILCPVENHGTILARVGTVTLQQPSVMNLGVLKAEGGGSLQFTGINADVTVTNRGVLEAATNSAISLTGGWFNNARSLTLHGGELRGPGRIDISGIRVYLRGDTEPIRLRDSTVVIYGNTECEARGTFAFDGGTLRIQSSASGIGTRPASLVLSGPVTLDGNGTLEFRQSGQGYENRIIGDGPLTVNSGMNVLCPAGIQATITVPVSHHGRWLSHGGMTVDAVVLTNHTDGVIGGTGSLTFSRGGSLRNAGTIAPGASAGLFTVVGSVVNEPGAVHQIEIGGATAAAHDRLQVFGSVTLAGRLEVSLLNGFTPTTNDTFTVLTATPCGNFLRDHRTCPRSRPCLAGLHVNKRRAAGRQRRSAARSYAALAAQQRCAAQDDTDGDGWANLADTSWAESSRRPRGVPPRRTVLMAAIYPVRLAALLRASDIH
ncbi:MAG: hypothetical protein HS113_09300 [Verrucomicrobiales bacterium]|nr:hypothetical protein [Verrucomicrobiales bacterium]